MMEAAGRNKPNLSAGWLLVTGLLLLCLIGTGLTWWNYSRQVFSSAGGIVLESQGPLGTESHIAVELPTQEAMQVLPGHGVRVTVGSNTRLFRGEVVSVTPGTPKATVIIRILADPADAGVHVGTIASAGMEKKASDLPLPLPVGARCDVTIDTTVPPYSLGK
jgi:hypothetical protein